MSSGYPILTSMTLASNTSHGLSMPAEMDAHSHGKGRLMIRQITLWVRVVSAVLGLFLPVYSEAAMGALMQLSGTAGCVSENGTGGSCVAGRGLGGAGWVANRQVDLNLSSDRWHRSSLAASKPPASIAADLAHRRSVSARSLVGGARTGQYALCRTA